LATRSPSEATEHEADITYLTKLAGRLGHDQRRDLAAGKVSPDRKWTIADANRLQPEQERIRQTHEKLTMASSP
jgi:hypothetical protein